MFWRGVIGYLPVNIVQGVVGLLTIVVFTRLLSPSDYGAYALAFSVMSLVHTMVFTWLEAAMARFYVREAQGPQLDNHFATLWRGFTILALVFPLAAAPALWLWPASGPLKIAIGAGLTSILFRSALKLVQERRRAAGDVRAAAVIDVAQTGGGFVAGAAMAAMGLGGAAPLAGAGAVAAMCLAFTLPGELKPLRSGRLQLGRLASYAAYGLPISLSLVLSLVLATTDRFFLAAYLNAASVGVYHAGYSLANRTLDVMFIWLGMAGGPALVAALERGGSDALRHAAKEQAQLMLLVTLPAAAGLALVAKPLAALMVGPDLAAGAGQVTPWIAFSALFSGITTYYLHQAFTLGRRTGLLAAAMAAPALCNLALNAALVPRFGLDGALWATAASYAMGAAASFGLGRFALALPIPWNALCRCGLATAAMSLAVAAIPALGGAAELAIKTVVGAVVYGVLVMALDAGGARSQLRQGMQVLNSRAARAT